jgi:hypothetical protein
MKTKSRKAAPDRKSDALATDDTAIVLNPRPVVLAMPPEEIADDGETRLGCVLISGRFPVFRR